jgi:hypothetical protein
MCHAKQDDVDNNDAPPTPIRPGFYRDHVDHSPPHPPWTYPFDSAYEYAAEFVSKIKELEGGTILLNRNGKSPSWRSQTRLNQEGPPDVSWDSARQHWSRKATFYSAIENPVTGNEYIEKLQALIVEKGRHAHVNGNVVASAFRAFADSMPKKRKAAPAAPV